MSIFLEPLQISHLIIHFLFIQIQFVAHISVLLNQLLYNNILFGILSAQTLWRFTEFRLEDGVEFSDSLVFQDVVFESLLFGNLHHNDISIPQLLIFIGQLIDFISGIVELFNEVVIGVLLHLLLGH